MQNIQLLWEFKGHQMILNHRFPSTNESIYLLTAAKLHYFAGQYDRKQHCLSV